MVLVTQSPNNGQGKEPTTMVPAWWPFTAVLILFFSGLVAFFYQLYRGDYDHPWFYVVVLAFVGIATPDLVVQFIRRRM